MNYQNTRFPGRFTPIFDFNFYFLLFYRFLSWILKIEFFLNKFFKFLPSINLSWDLVESHNKFGSDPFTRFTNTQAYKHTSIQAYKHTSIQAYKQSIYRKSRGGTNHSTIREQGGASMNLVEPVANIV